MAAGRRVRSRLLRAALALAVLALADQLVLFLLLDDGWFLGRRIAPFDPPLFTKNQMSSLERIEASLQARASYRNPSAPVQVQSVKTRQMNTCRLLRPRPCSRRL